MTIAKIDAHHHLWTAGSPHHPVLASPPTERFYGNTGRLIRQFGPAEFATLAATQHVVGSVYVESHFDPPNEEIQAVDVIADRYGLPGAIMGRADISAESLGTALAVYLRTPRFRGLRLAINWDRDPRFRSAPRNGLLGEAAWRRGYGLLGTMGLIAEVMALPAQLEALAALAADCADTQLVIGHAGLPAARTASEVAAWRNGMRALAKLPHVTVKISGLGMVDHGWTNASIAPIVREIVTLFGAERCMFGSNFPIDGLHASYDRIWTAFEEITWDMSSEIRRALFHDTAARVFRPV